MACYCAQREQTLKKFQTKLSATAKEMGYQEPRTYSREIMLERINTYKRQNSFVGYVAIEHACIHLCIIFEDLIRRIVLKYYEEDINRLKSKKETIKNEHLVDLVLGGYNIHRTLAEKVVDDLMYGSVDDWYEALGKIGMNIVASQDIKELFLIRNCIVHNDKRVSAQLYKVLPNQYKFRKSIHLSLGDFERFLDSIQRSASFIFSEYNRLFPTNTGTWVGINRYNDT